MEARQQEKERASQQNSADERGGGESGGRHSGQNADWRTVLEVGEIDQLVQYLVENSK